MASPEVQESGGVLDPLAIAVNSARVCVERFRVRPQSIDLLSTALRELDDAMTLLNERASVPMVPLADAEKLATALDYITALNTAMRPPDVNWFHTAEIMREKATEALSEFRAAHPREEATDGA